jgi:bacterioferritin (cytochrome b1)
MKKITTKSELREKITHILTIEKTARNDYKKDLDLFNNPKITSVISVIKKDEDKHIEMIEEILSIIKK